MTLDGIQLQTRLNKLSHGLPEVAFPRPVVWHLALRRGNRCLKRKASPNSFVYGSLPDSIKSASSSHADKIISFNRDGNKTAPIFRALLRTCSPTAIIRTIIAARIQTIYRPISAWMLAHVFKKSDKGCVPALTYGYAASAISRIILTVRVITTALHAKPCPILSADFPSRLVAVDYFTRCGHMKDHKTAIIPCQIGLSI